MLTPYHSTYFAHELTRRAASDDPEKLGVSLFNATIDLNPHQVDAALFAFRSPLSRGAILADEVGLGKTIEAGLILSQLWAERRRHVLIVCPTMLRKQWAQELQDKFGIESVILDKRAFNAARKRGDPPFEPKDQVVICSFHFASAQQLEIFKVFWDLVIIDEAHRLRNVYKNPSGIAAKIQTALENRPKVLLTATPLQNTLLELYGLVSFIDPFMFGDLEAFRARYMRGPVAEREFKDLRERLAPICQRTLRRQVQEYVRFTNRIPLTQGFEPHADEQKLYELVSAYLQREDTAAIPKRQRQLLILILRKILASSSFAIANTLDTLINRLGTRHGDALEQLEEDVETASESADEWAEQGQLDGDDDDRLTPEDIRREMEELSEYLELARSIKENAKGQALLTALVEGFRKMEALGGNRKAVVFTESKRTQAYLAELLTANGYAGRIVLLSGSGSDPASNEIYRKWVERHKGTSAATGSKAVDFRSALVEEFRDRADVLIATEAGAEGINLQFCSLVVNYDLPWNPQRVEQRIGRCHRYGQKHDVVVVNFLNQKNEADLRVYQLLAEKFRLFEGVFGASDQILGVLESGVDFERRILDIYQSCRTKQEIDGAFDQLRLELDDQIKVTLDEAQRKILENFDGEVRDRIRSTEKSAKTRLDSIGRMLWNLTKFELRDEADFDDDSFEFLLKDGDWQETGAPPGPYRLAQHGEDANGAIRFSLSSLLAECLIRTAADRKPEPAHVVFTYGSEKAGLLEPYVGKTGWLTLSLLEIASAKDQEDRLLFSVLDQDGNLLDPDFGAKLFTQDAQEWTPTMVPEDMDVALKKRTEHVKNIALNKIAERNKEFFEQELDKLERWADDLKHGLEVDIRELDRKIRQLGKDVRLAPTLEDKVKLSREKATAEAERNRKRRELYEAQDKVEADKATLIEDIENRLRTNSTIAPLFTIAWEIA